MYIIWDNFCQGKELTPPCKLLHILHPTSIPALPLLKSSTWSFDRAWASWESLQISPSPTLCHSSKDGAFRLQVSKAQGRYEVNQIEMMRKKRQEYLQESYVYPKYVSNTYIKIKVGFLVVLLLLLLFCFVFLEKKWTPYFSLVTVKNTTLQGSESLQMAFPFEACGRESREKLEKFRKHAIVLWYLIKETIHFFERSFFFFLHWNNINKSTQALV